MHNQTVAAVFASYPASVRAPLLRLRDLIFEVAAETEGVGSIEEALKWGEPAYLTNETKSGSTIRIAWKKAQPDQYSMYFICTTNLVQTFRLMFPREFAFEGNRAINFDVGVVVPEDSLRHCIAAALTYRLQPKPKHRALVARPREA
jgi:Domain of unknown function (DU1801)